MTATARDAMMCKVAPAAPARAEVYELRVAHSDGAVSVSQCRVNHFAKAKFAVVELAKDLFKRGAYGTVSLVGAFEMERFLVCPKGVRDDRHGGRKRR